MLTTLNNSANFSDSEFVKTTHTKNRIEFIDLAKGICIVLVVLGHTGVYLFDYGANIAHLRMPLYFFLSGIFFKDYGGFIRTIMRKADKLLIPFLFFFLLNVILMVCLKKMTSSPIPELNYFFQNGRITVMSLWFLLCLFWQSVLFSLAFQLTHKIYLIGVATAIFSMIGILLSNHGIILPLYLDSALSFSPFFFLGFSLRKTDVLIPNKYDKYNIPIAVLLLAIATVIGYANNSTVVDYVYNEYDGNIVLHFIQSVLIVMAMIYVCKSVGKLPIISYAGRYSIIILVMHGIYLKILSSFNQFAGYQPSPYALFAAVMILSILSIEPMRRWFPYVTAQKNLISSKLVDNKNQNN